MAWGGRGVELMHIWQPVIYIPKTKSRRGKEGSSGERLAVLLFFILKKKIHAQATIQKRGGGKENPNIKYSRTVVNEKIIIITRALQGFLSNKLNT